MYLLSYNKIDVWIYLRHSIWLIDLFKFSVLIVINMKTKSAVHFGNVFMFKMHIYAFCFQFERLNVLDHDLELY